MARRRPPSVHGVVVVDKPAGPTSQDVVGMLRRRFGERRVGHSGTLDPPATGILVCALGHATRLLRFVTALPKTYTGEVVMGATTTTLDDHGDTVERFHMAPMIDEVRSAADGLTGDILQIPPMVSALRVDGRRLHELARDGIEVDREARPVSVHRFDVAPTTDPSVFSIEVECGSGTYVRSLAADLGSALGGGAHLRGLRRTAIGSFVETCAAPADEVVLLPVSAAVRDYDSVTVAHDEAVRIGNGARLPSDRYGGEGPWCIVTGDDFLLAVHERVDGRIRAGVVLPSPAD